MRRLGNRNQFLCFSCPNSEWLFQVNVAAELHAGFCQVEVRLWRSRDVNHVRLGLIEQLRDVAEHPPDRKSLCQLLGHQRFAVTHANNFATRNSRDLCGM